MLEMEIIGRNIHSKLIVPKCNLLKRPSLLHNASCRENVFSKCIQIVIYLNVIFFTDYDVYEVLPGCKHDNVVNSYVNICIILVLKYECIDILIVIVINCPVFNI